MSLEEQYIKNLDSMLGIIKENASLKADIPNIKRDISTEIQEAKRDTLEQIHKNYGDYFKDIKEYLHTLKNIKTAERGQNLIAMEDKRACLKVLDRIADLIEKRPAFVYLILFIISMKMGIDIYSFAKVIMIAVGIK